MTYPERRYIQSVYWKIQRREINPQVSCMNCESAVSCGFHPGLCCECVTAALPKAPHRGVAGSVSGMETRQVGAWS